MNIFDFTIKELNDLRQWQQEARVGPNVVPSVVEIDEGKYPFLYKVSKIYFKENFPLGD